MTALLAIFRHLQLFFFGFALAASTMLFIGIASGRLDRGPVYLGMAEQFAAVMVQHPAFLAAMAGTAVAPDPTVQRARLDVTPDQVPAAVESGDMRTSSALPPVPKVGAVRPAADSLRALRTRQFAGLQSR